MSKSVVHLHWLWRKGPMASKNVTLGTSACGVYRLLPGQFTAHLADTTCDTCKEIAKQVPLVATPPAPNNEVISLRKRGSINESGIIKLLVKHNPRKAGTPKHSRMAILMQHNGKTVKEFLKAGGNPLTLKNAMKENLVEVEE
jgi:hypothetical protein